MKLLKNSRPEEGSGQCSATTKSGSRCSRDVAIHGYCKQHYRLLKEKGLIVDALGDNPLSELPEIPDNIDLEALGRRQWQYYCKYLIDQGRLFQIMLQALGTLCYLEEQLEEAKEAIKNHGAVNFYESTIQRNGFASHFDKILTHIRGMRGDLGLTGAADNGASDENTGHVKQGYQNRKAKDW